MYCPNCGKEIPEGSRFCMHCGADLMGSSPKIEVAPKISVSAKAEGVPYPKWKPKEEKYVNVAGEGVTPVYTIFAEFGGKPFCPNCENYGSLVSTAYIVNELREEKRDKIVYAKHLLYECKACGKKFLKFETTISIDKKKYFTTEYGVIDECASPLPSCPKCHSCNFHIIDTFCEKVKLKGSIIMNLYDVYICDSCRYKFLCYKGVWEKSLYVPYKPLKREPLCEVCEISPYFYTCEICGVSLCDRCVLMAPKGISYKYICPTCAAQRMCEICGKEVGVYTCSVCGKRICESCSYGIISKKCSNCR